LSPIAPSALSAPNLSVCQFIELLITIGSIDSSKVPAARKVFGCGITTVTAPVTTFLAKAPLLTMNLYPEMRSPQVIALKKFLSKYGYLSGVSGTDYYGTLTVEAVQKFQKAKNIITVGTPSTTGYGAVGPKTRALINQIGL
jgi:hypothetical protein